MILAAAQKVGDPLAFYEVAATIIPVLFLALIYQSGVIEGIGKDTPAARVFLGAVWFAGNTVLGETVSLRVLATQNPTAMSRGWVAVSLASLTFWLIGSQVYDGLIKMVSTHGTKSLKLAISTLILVFGGLLLIGAFSAELL